MNTQTKKVPKLRFKEFSGEWINKPFSAVASIRKGKFDPTKNKLSMKCIELEHLSQNTGEILGYIRSESVQSIKNIFKKGDVLFGKLRPNLRKYALAPFDGICSSEIWGLYSDIVPNDFLFQIVQSDRFYEQSTISTGTKMPRADWKVIAVCDFYFPLEIKEQQKIADFLYSVDKKIQHLKQKKQLLEQYKKGMMQKLFSQQIRFKDENGMDYPEWTLVLAKSLFKNISNKNHNSDLPILAVTQDQGVVKRSEIDKHITSSKESIASYKVIDAGDFIISLRSFQGGIEYSHITGICSPAYTILKSNKPIIDDFFRHYFKKESFISQLSMTVIGIRDGKQISYDAFSGLKLPFPSLPEQQKIADFLSSIDKKIDGVNSQITQTEQFKKGLLQQLFV